MVIDDFLFGATGLFLHLPFWLMKPATVF